MLKQLLAGALLVTLGTAGTSFAEPRDPGGIHEFALEPRDPGGLHELDRSMAATDGALESRPVTRALLTDIVTWLSSKFDLPAIHDHPRVEFAPPLKIAAMRYKGMLPLAWREDSIRDPAAQTAGLREVVAIYRDDTKTIYLNESWTGTSPAEMSILVHEMVHHLQNRAGMKFECPAAREKLAYQAQNEWLKRFGRDLEKDFEIDMLTLLVTSACMN